jgi:hypothetical protein
MVINTIGYIELVQKKLDDLDAAAKSKYLALNPNFPLLKLSDPANYLLVNKLHEVEALPDQLVEHFPDFVELKEEIKSYLQESDKRAELLLSGEIITPEFTAEELNSFLLITEEELAQFFMEKTTYLNEVVNGKKA